MPEDHRGFLDQALPVFQADPRLLGVAGAGSFITRTMDEFSDIDLVLVHSHEATSEILKERESIATKLGRLVAAFTGEHVGEPRLLICLYDRPVLHVDLKFVKTVAHYDFRSCVDATRACIEAYLELRRISGDSKLRKNDQAQQVALEYLARIIRGSEQTRS